MLFPFDVNAALTGSPALLSRDCFAKCFGAYIRVFPGSEKAFGGVEYAQLET